ncbi:MAG TPA: ATP-binding protein, partial [Polyangiaceae bacterium]
VGRILAANGAACRLHGVDRYELVGLRIHELLPAQSDVDQLIQSLRQRGEAFMELSETAQGRAASTRLDGRRFRPQRYLLTLRDVTQEKAMESMLEREYARDTMAGSAAGILHDVNNLLVPVVAYAAALVARGHLEDEALQMFGELRLAAERTGVLARKLLSLGQPKKEGPVFLQMNEVIGQFAEMLKRVAGTRVELVMKLSPDLVMVNVDRERLERVLLNLVLNARDAMPNGGTLTIQTANHRGAEPLVSQALPLQSLPRSARTDLVYATLSVSDTGVGMEPQTRARIFEPFFTTKVQGTGTGLGLPSALLFANRSGGYIDVETEVGQGTTVRIALPEIERIANA